MQPNVYVIAGKFYYKNEKGEFVPFSFGGAGKGRPGKDFTPIQAYAYLLTNAAPKLFRNL